jgi:dienelactone hydrolase
MRDTASNSAASMVLSLLLIFTTGSALAQASATIQASETIEVSRVYAGKTIVLKPVIHWPSGNGPFGVVVVVNSSAGAEDIFLKATHPVMNKAGIAVAYLDTFTPRGVRDTISEQARVLTTDMAIDALYVAEALRKHPRIKPDKVAMQGQSKGAVATVHAATREWHSWSGNSLRPFDAHVAFAPSCELQFREPELVSPLFAMLGEKDDCTMPAPCVKLFERMRSAGQKITFEVVPGAVHSWSTHDYVRLPEGFSARNCADEPLYYTRDGFVSSKDGSKIGFADVYRRCGAKGFFAGGPSDKRGYVLEKAAAWLKQGGW